jgi:acyl carrier protein
LPTIQDRTKLIIGAFLAPDHADLSDNSTFDSLGIDSLDIVDLVIALEDEFSVDIPDDQIGNLKTVSDAVRFIEGAKV